MKCPICKKRFRLDKKNLYHVKRIAFTLTDVYYECIDCPKCGCQVRLHERYDCKVSKKE